MAATANEASNAYVKPIIGLSYKKDKADVTAVRGQHEIYNKVRPLLFSKRSFVYAREVADRLAIKPRELVQFDHVHTALARLAF